MKIDATEIIWIFLLTAAFWVIAMDTFCWRPL